MKTASCTRREAIQRVGLLGASLLFSGNDSVLGNTVSQKDKVRIAAIGCGGRGEVNLSIINQPEATSMCEIVALCDVDENFLTSQHKKNPQAKLFRDYRKMFDEMHKQIDAVIISTPDHTHAHLSILAMRLGKHVYCEKPLTKTIEEARLMAKVAAESKVATQMGTQGMASNSSRTAIEVLRSGVLGTVREIHVWTDRSKGWWPQGVDRPVGTPPLPPTLDWNLWLGGAPYRPYHPAYVPFKWRGWKDFGTGAIGDMGIHNAAVVWTGLQLGIPRKVQIIESSELKSETYPTWSILHYEFPSTSTRQSIPLYWYDGGKKPPKDIIQDDLADNGAIVIGSDATFYMPAPQSGSWYLLPKEKFQGYSVPQSLPRTGTYYIGHYLEWLLACKGKTTTFCNFSDIGSPLTEVMLIGALALQTGKTILWNAEKMQADNCPEADAFIRCHYRNGWNIS